MWWTKAGYYFFMLINWSINEYAIVCFSKMFPVTNILLHTISSDIRYILNMNILQNMCSGGWTVTIDLKMN